MQEENQFAPNHERVFGSIGRVDFNFEGNKLTISGGGVLLGGWFYKLEGEASFTIKGATRYLSLMVDKYEGGDRNSKWRKTDKAIVTNIIL